MIVASVKLGDFKSRRTVWPSSIMVFPSISLADDAKCRLAHFSESNHRANGRPLITSCFICTWTAADGRLNESGCLGNGLGVSDSGRVTGPISDFNGHFSGLAPDIVALIVMATSIHVPKPLLAAVDRKARSLRLSRNQLILRALEREVAAGTDWSAGFFERLEETDRETAKAVDSLLTAIRGARRSKEPPDL
jgi:predicted transcriptional regulator